MKTPYGQVSGNEPMNEKTILRYQEVIINLCEEMAKPAAWTTTVVNTLFIASLLVINM